MSFISIHQIYVGRIQITLSALVIDCKIPFAMFSRLLFFFCDVENSIGN